MLQFRNATIQDLTWIVQVYNQTIPSQMVTADIEPVTVESRYPWFRDHNTQSRPLYVVMLDDHIRIGWVSYQDFYGRPAYQATAEISIYLEETCRGKGFGKMILTTCVEKAASLGIRHLVGFIFAHNLPSLRLFESVGFEKWGFLPDIALLHGKERSLCIVGKHV